VDRVTVTLDEAHALKLPRLAERTHTNEGTLAHSLLASALDEADPDPRHIAELVDGIPGAFERAQLGLTGTRRPRHTARRAVAMTGSLSFRLRPRTLLA
jgi:hypothetical protein